MGTHKTYPCRWDVEISWWIWCRLSSRFQTLPIGPDCIKCTCSLPWPSAMPPTLPEMVHLKAGGHAGPASGTLALEAGGLRRCRPCPLSSRLCTTGLVGGGRAWSLGFPRGGQRSCEEVEPAGRGAYCGRAGRRQCCPESTYLAQRDPSLPPGAAEAIPTLLCHPREAFVPTGGMGVRGASHLPFVSF